jgi:hypothetical protein
MFDPDEVVKGMVQRAEQYAIVLPLGFLLIWAYLKTVIAIFGDHPGVIFSAWPISIVIMFVLGWIFVK